MTQLLRSVNLATRFQILMEVAAKQPDIQQKDIAESLELSPQAVSDYIRELVRDGWLVSEGRSKYRVTRDGVNWVLKELREWQRYSEAVRKAIAGVSICAALADSDLSEGQKVGLVMRDGLLFATGEATGGASGKAAFSAKKGEDAGIADIEGIVSLEIGKVTVVRVPGIQRGGSRSTDLGKIKKAVKGKRQVFAIGIEALVALRKAGTEPASLYGVVDAAIEAAHCGLFPAVVCVEDDTSGLLRGLEDNNIDYEILDARTSSARQSF